MFPAAHAFIRADVCLIPIPAAGAGPAPPPSWTDCLPPFSFVFMLARHLCAGGARPAPPTWTCCPRLPMPSTRGCLLCFPFLQLVLARLLFLPGQTACRCFQSFSYLHATCLQVVLARLLFLPGHAVPHRARLVGPAVLNKGAPRGAAVMRHPAGVSVWPFGLPWGSRGCSRRGPQQCGAVPADHAGYSMQFRLLPAQCARMQQR